MRFPQLPSVRDANKIVVGVVSVVVIGALVAFAFAIGTLGLLENRYQVTAVFEDTSGIRSGNRVRIAGVNVGEVSGVDADFETGQVIVSIDVNDGVDVGHDARAEIAFSTLLGGTYVRLSGPVEEPYMADLPEEERRIPLERTKVPYSILGALGDTTEVVEQLDVEAVNQVLRDLASATGRNEDAVANLVAELASVSRAINEREAQLRSLVGNAQDVTATLAQRDQQLAALLDSASVVLDQLSDRRDELSDLLGSGSSAVSQLADLISSQRANLDKIIADLHITLGAVDRQFDNVSQTLAFAGPTFIGLSRVGNPEQQWINVVVTGLGPESANILSDILGTVLGPILGGTP